MQKLVYKINNHLYAGPHPGYNFDGKQEDVNENISFLKKLKINHIVDLSTKKDIDKFKLHGYKEIIKNHNITFKIFPFPDMGVPDIDTMREILEHIYTQTMNFKYIYVHCVAGLGRTGTVIGCYLKECGIQDPIADLYILREFCVPCYLASPITHSQYMFIRNWKVE